MILLEQDFYNKATSDLKGIYFPNENHGTTENKGYHRLNYALECFSNGCLTYGKLINKLAKACKTTTTDIHAIVKKHVISFAPYEYKPTN